jgi:hypothetical protein
MRLVNVSSDFAPPIEKRVMANIQETVLKKRKATMEKEILLDAKD